MHLLWRIHWRGQPFDGVATSGSGGRWNSVGTRMIYTSTSIALAALETLVHLNSSGLPVGRELLRIVVPDNVWESTEQIVAAPGWDMDSTWISAPQGDAWAKSGKSLMAIVPSVIVPEEPNVLLNPLHPDFSLIQVVTQRVWTYDPRLFKSADPGK